MLIAEKNVDIQNASEIIEKLFCILKKVKYIFMYKLYDIL